MLLLSDFELVLVCCKTKPTKHKALFFSEILLEPMEFKPFKWASHVYV